MPSAVVDAISPVSIFGPVQTALEKAHRLFRRSSTLGHTLRIASSVEMMGPARRAKQVRSVRSVWGVRRDDYYWRSGIGRRDCAILRRGAQAIAWALVQAPLPGWNALLPGTMQQLMGTSSDLYLADYWLLTLHYLVWSGRLPYPIRARWVQGTSIHEPQFDFVSELPTDLAEASMEALILFREAAVGPAVGGDEAGPIEPPVLRDGHWRIVTRGNPRPPQTAPTLFGNNEPVVSETAIVPASLPKAADSVPDSPTDCMPTLDDQSFTIRACGASYRFTARNKQLFALLERIRRRPGYRVSFDDMRGTGDVWDGSQVEDSTIRGAVARLRKLLKEHAMGQLAQRIITGTYRGSGYVVLQSDDAQDAAA